jgi:hypothetical protein
MNQARRLTTFAVLVGNNMDNNTHIMVSDYSHKNYQGTILLCCRGS